MVKIKQFAQNENYFGQRKILRIKLKENENKIILCDECGSDYFSLSSKMSNLCSECVYILYGYENCKHQFMDGRCEKCYWTGNTSEYLKSCKKSN